MQYLLQEKKLASIFFAYMFQISVVLKFWQTIYERQAKFARSRSPLIKSNVKSKMGNKTSTFSTSSTSRPNGTSKASTSARPLSLKRTSKDMLCPLSLHQKEIVNFNCRALVATVPFFTNADHNFVTEVVIKLKFEIFQPGDNIIKEGSIGTKMYFIQEGIVHIIKKDGDIATSLSDGSYFGEICLLANTRRVASVQAQTYCCLYSLDQESFRDVLDHYPVMRRTMESIAAERLNKIGQNPYVFMNRINLKDDLKLVNEIMNENLYETHNILSTSSSKNQHEPNKPILMQEYLKIRRKALEVGLQWKRKAKENKHNTEPTK